ncbi:MAG TPA: outer membrane beta-barrel protein [Methylomirabilota bacterium]|nr:outer membrane beta-barrel protein [Methylomirabilota bacterium]
MLVSLSVLLVGLSVSPARAVDMNAVFPDLDLPGFKLTPFITERVEYESNVFQAPSRAKDDIIFKTIPGLLLELPIGPHRLDLGMRAEILNFVDLSDQNATHFFLLGNLALHFPGGLSMAVKEDFIYTTDPPGSELTGRIRSTTNTLAPSVEYAIARRFAIGADYTWTHVDFEKSVEALDRDEHTWGLTGFWKVAPKTDLLANAGYGYKDFDKDSDRNVDRLFGVVGVRGQITPRLTSTFRIGYEAREPRDDDKTAYHGLIASGDWVWTPTDRTRLTLVTERFVAESVFGTNFWFLANMVTLSAEQKLTPKLTALARVFGGTNEYPDKAAKLNSVQAWRYDEILGATLGIDYQIQRWLGIGADYTHTRRYSNFNQFQFKNDIVGAKVTLSF